MAAGLLWLARVPASSAPWQANPADPASYIPTGDFLIDVLPGLLVFGVGISLLVAPLTTALMSSVPLRNAGLGSAINNAISRVGSPLMSALLFIVISATFYPSLASKLPDIDVSSPDVREQVQPLARPRDGTNPELAIAARDASTDAFHLSMLVSAALCAAGGAINAIGIRNPSRQPASSRAEAAPLA